MECCWSRGPVIFNLQTTGRLRRVTKNVGLSAARTAKKDEFYTQWPDIEREMNAYLEFDPDVFRDKTVLLPCDDPEWSSFTKFFALHFEDFGLKKLVSTSYAAERKPPEIGYQPTLFEVEDPQFDSTKTRSRGKKFTLQREDLNRDGIVNIDDLKWEYLEGDGDFRSPEVTSLRDEADIIITNPPFSLFQVFLDWIMTGQKKFAIVGHQNAITYKGTFPLIKANKVWLGKGFPRNMAHFNSPYVASQWVELQDEGVVRVSGVQWYTNIDHGRRHERLQLMTTEENTKYSKHKSVQGVGYRKYDNYEAIEVPKSDAVPSDHTGVMGVPITFLNKYSPEQFEIIGASESEGKGFSNGLWDASSKIAQPVVDGNKVYKRLFIRHRGSKED